MMVESKWRQAHRIARDISETAMTLRFEAERGRGPAFFQALDQLHDLQAEMTIHLASQKEI